MRLHARASALSLLALVGLVGACSGDDEADPDEANHEPVLEVATGADPTCLRVDEALPPEVEELPVIECARRHSHEVYATVAYDEQDVYPGVEAFEAFAEVECLKQFEGFVGISVFDSDLSYSWLVPSLSGWNDEDDRDVLCVLADGEGAPLKGTMRGRQR